MRLPIFDMNIFKERRSKLADLTKGSAVILASHPEYIKNNDAHYPYRQDSNMFYMTGFEEPGALFVFRPGMNPETVMFVQPKDINAETWTGFRYGPKGAQDHYQMNVAYDYSKIETELPKLLKDVDSIYYSMFTNREVDGMLLKMIESISLARSRTNKGNLGILDARQVIGELRITKSPYEIEQMRKACQITAAAHVDLMKVTKPGITERALHGQFFQSIMSRGCAREGYGSIIAAGANATTLHYVFNDQVCRDGEMILIDAGGEYNYYSADITRSYPVNGKFSPVQKRVYQSLLSIQKSLIELVRPGASREAIQKETISQLTDLMIEEKLLRGKKEELIENKSYLKFYPHGVGHWLGLDVHDAGLTEVKGEPRPLSPGIVMTIEPGLYVPQDAQDVPNELRGLGLRIEDDILVTETGHENLTQSCPKEIEALESVIGKGL